MINRFLNWFIDFWVMLNYVFYKFYAKREKSAEVRSIIYAPGWVFFNYLTIGFAIDSMGYPLVSTFLEHRILCFFLPLAIIILPNYFFLYHKDKWKDIFRQIDKERDTEEVSKRYKNTVIYIWVTVALFLIPVIVGSLINQYG